jgi:8-oxo-dGTP pyrophosphatase MutT (NUDIX family)
MHETEEPETAARRELEEETSFTLAADATMRPLHAPLERRAELPLSVAGTG